jgi:hypothetical protein
MEYTDANHADDPDTSCSVAGFIVFSHGDIIP